MKRWDTFQLAFLAFCAALNVGIGAIVGIIKLPIYLDSIGTIISASLGGWLYGTVVGVLTVLIGSLVYSPTMLAYVGTASVIALCASIFVKYGFLRSWIITILGGLLIGIVAAIISAPVTTFFYGGVSLAGADALTAFFKVIGHTLLQSVILGGLASDPIDKLATSLIALVLIRTLPRRLFQRFPNGAILIPQENKKK